MISTGEIKRGITVDLINPIASRVAPDAVLVARYAELRARADAGALQILGL